MLLGGCSQTASSPTSGTAAPPSASTPASAPAPASPRLRATATQYTVDEASGDLRVGITNVGGTTVTVSSATLDWAGFERKRSVVEGGTLGPGDVAGVLMQHGAARCNAPPTGRARLRAVVDGVTREIPLTVEVPHLLVMLYQRECAERRLTETADLSLVMARKTVVAHGQEYLSGAVVLTRKQGSLGVTVQDLSGSVLLHFAPRGPRLLPARLGPSQSALRVPVLLASAHRCDPHARANSSQTFVLSVDVHLDGQPAQRVVVVPDKATQGTLLALIASDCH